MRGGSLTLNAGSICDNVIYGSNGAGGAVYVNEGDFTMNGGIIYDCAVGSGDYTSQGRGGGVYIAKGTFTMNGGQIANCGIRTAQYNVNRNVNTGYGGAVYVDNGATFIMNDGELGGYNDESYNAGLNNQASKRGSAVYIGNGSEDDPGGKFYFKGGSINGGYCSATNGGTVYVENGAYFEMSGDAELDHNYGAAVVIEQGGTFDLTGGTISNNTPGDPGVVSVDGAFNMTGGTITENYGSIGGGVFVNVHGAFNMSGGVITGNRGADAGGAVYLKTPTDDDPEYTGGTFTMTGGKITGNRVVGYNGNYPSRGNGDGGGVWVGDGCTFNMTGGEISGNASCLLMYADDIEYNDFDVHMGLGGGVYVRPNGVFNVSDSPVIKGNKIGNKPETLVPYTENNVFLEDNAKITIAGVLDGAEIGVYPHSRTARSNYISDDFVDEQTVSAGYTDILPELPPFAASFFCDADGYVVVRKNNEATLWKHTHTFETSVNAAGDTLTVGCTHPDCDYRAVLTITAADAEYTGEAVPAALEGVKIFNILTGLAVSDADIEYYKGEEKLSAAPADIGAYTAKYTYNGYSIEKSFAITAPVHDHVWNVTFSWSGNNDTGYTAEATYECTVPGCGETHTVTAAVSPALPAAKCVDAQTVTLTAAVAAADAPDGEARTDTKDVTVPAIGSHDLSDWETVTSATCTEDGLKRRVCSRCDYVEELLLEAPGSHDFDDTIEQNVTVVEPTCLVDGSKTVKCSRCDAVDVTELKAPGSHDFDDTIEQNVTVVEPTCLVDGSKTVKCSRCDAVDVTELKAPGSHDFDESIESNVTVVEPTCLVDGSKTVKCSRCDATEVTVLQALGHDFGEWTVNSPATCTGAGEESRVCARCDKTESREIEALGHDWSAWTVVALATDTEEGLERRTCNRCSAEESRVIPANGDEPCSICRRIKCSIYDWILDYFRSIINIFANMFKSVEC